jgi:hypothetical protein
MLQNNCMLNQLKTKYDDSLAGYQLAKGMTFVPGPVTDWTTAYANAAEDIAMQDEDYLKVASAKAQFDLMFYYVKTSHTAEVCAYKGDEQNAAVVKTHSVLFMPDEKQCAKVLAAKEAIEAGPAKELLEQAATSAECAKPTTTEPTTSPTDCAGEYSEWGECSRKCDGGTRTRKFTVNVAAANGGEQCPLKDGASESEACNAQKCEVTAKEEAVEFDAAHTDAEIDKALEDVTALETKEEATHPELADCYTDGPSVFDEEDWFLEFMAPLKGKSCFEVASNSCVSCFEGAYEFLNSQKCLTFYSEKCFKVYPKVCEGLSNAHEGLSEEECKSQWIPGVKEAIKHAHEAAANPQNAE